ncbi:hypothetical protein Catovirus_1_32 [Catovirus CTV1]|uniref:Uncharacterized protein n=1 Tax=Catovirus CTV1 TaxID=1977631 RepID=A0A1V0S8E8_9VIRU|nr:hypothetical protein Catovirus_1_32 [Catovirus CTV1]
MIFEKDFRKTYNKSKSYDDMKKIFYEQKNELRFVKSVVINIEDKNIEIPAIGSTYFMKNIKTNIKLHNITKIQLWKRYPKFNVCLNTVENVVTDNGKTNFFQTLNKFYNLPSNNIPIFCHSNEYIPLTDLLITLDFCENCEINPSDIIEYDLFESLSKDNSCSMLVERMKKLHKEEHSFSQKNNQINIDEFMWPMSYIMIVGNAFKHNNIVKIELILDDYCFDIIKHIKYLNDTTILIDFRLKNDKEDFDCSHLDFTYGWTKKIRLSFSDIKKCNYEIYSFHKNVLINRDDYYGYKY